MRAGAQKDGHWATRHTAEGRRLTGQAEMAWRQWGPYLSERQWGTVREDYSATGDSWDYLPHNHARSFAYRWGEDGIGGFADSHLNLCLAVALWNGKDPILKERLFGLNNAEGNHGEDVKEQYYYLDGLPTHYYMKMLYKYPQARFPYEDLLAVNRERGLHDREYELLDTGIFDQDRYFDVMIEYAKAAPDDILLEITIHNRAADAALIHVLPHLWALNIWSWNQDQMKPRLEAANNQKILAHHPDLPTMALDCPDASALLFCENDTNTPLLYDVNAVGFFKDGINDYVVGGRYDAVNPDRRGTKAAAHYVLDIPGLGSQRLCLRLRPNHAAPAAKTFDVVMAQRRAEADEFYAVLQQGIPDEDSRRVQRQAFAGLLWSKQYYAFDVRLWLNGDPGEPPPPPERKSGRDADWGHLTAGDIISMPDTWEYPWFASWDLAFHCVTFALIDPAFAKTQLDLLTEQRFMHPNGQIPAYEWALGDANPPVQAWAAMQIYRMDHRCCGKGDTEFLRRIFHKLMINFTWWVNRKDAEGKNIFQGGFLGLDNIGLFDRNKSLPIDGHIDQSDGTAWVAMYALNLLSMALELATDDHVYEDLATKFFEHFLYIAEAVHAMGGETGTGLWDDNDGFYYDVLQVDGKPGVSLRSRSIVGLIPLFAVQVIRDESVEKLSAFAERVKWFLKHRPDLAKLVSHFTDKNKYAYSLLALMRRDRLKRVLSRMLDETEFLSDHGIRALSKYHEAHPYVFEQDGQSFAIQYTPAEATTRLFGGNSNWRGPVWMPVNYLIIQSLHKYYEFYNDDYVVEYPSRSGKFLNLKQIALELTERLKRLFLRGSDGKRVCFGDYDRLQNDPEFRDHILFFEYFDGDTGRGVGASHQTGWTGLIALLLHPHDEIDPRPVFSKSDHAPAIKEHHERHPRQRSVGTSDA